MLVLGAERALRLPEPLPAHQCPQAGMELPGFVTSDYGALHSTLGERLVAPIRSSRSTPTTERRSGRCAERDSSPPPWRTHGPADLHRDVPLNFIRRPPTGSTSATVTTPGHVRCPTWSPRRHGAPEKRRPHPSPIGQERRKGRRDRALGVASPTYAGGGSAYVIPSNTVSPLQGLQAAAGAGTHIVYRQGLPTDTSLPAIPSSDLSPAYSPTPFGGSSGDSDSPSDWNLRAGHRQQLRLLPPTYLSLNGKQLVDNPARLRWYLFGRGEAPGGTAIHGPDQRRIGQPHLGHPVVPRVRHLQGRRRSQVREDRGCGRLRRHRIRGHRPAQPQPALGAERADLQSRRGQPAHRRGGQRRRADSHAVAFQGRGSARRVVPRPDQRHRARSGGVRQREPRWHLPVTFPKNLSQVPAHTTPQFPGNGVSVRYSEGIHVGYRWYDTKNITPLFPFGYGLSYTRFKFSNLAVSPQTTDGVHTCGVGHDHQHRCSRGDRRGSAVPGRPGLKR